MNIVKFFEEFKIQAAKDEASEKEDLDYLARLLDLEKTTKEEWWQYDEIMVAVAQIIRRLGKFSTGSEYIDFFGNPWHWTGLIRTWIKEFKEKKDNLVIVCKNKTGLEYKARQRATEELLKVHKEQFESLVELYMDYYRDGLDKEE
jgi:hypothetical protein